MTAGLISPRLCCIKHTICAPGPKKTKRKTFSAVRFERCLLFAQVSVWRSDCGEQSAGPQSSFSHLSFSGSGSAPPAALPQLGGRTRDARTHIGTVIICTGRPVRPCCFSWRVTGRSFCLCFCWQLRFIIFRLNEAQMDRETTQHCRIRLLWRELQRKFSGPESFFLFVFDLLVLFLNIQ